MEVTEFFSDRAAVYARFRPHYPEAFIKFLLESLPAQATIADIGAGTGILSGQLLGAGYTVFAIEPSAPMRSEAEQRLCSQVRFHSLNGSAEATSLPMSSVEGVTCAQSFHWFDRAGCRSEFERILREPKLVFLIWNEEVLEGPLEEYSRILRAATPAFESFNWRNIQDHDFAAFFAPAPFERFYFSNPQSLDRETFVGRLLSGSHVPAAGQPGHQALIEKMTAFFERHAKAGLLEFSYRTRVDVGRIG